MKWLGLITWIALCLVAGFIGSLFSPGEWYQSLEKSSLTPPNIVFPIVWNSLFILMGISAWRIWEKGSQGTRFALVLFIVQLSLNVMWSYLFFGLHRPDLALIEIVILWTAILLTAVAFFRIERTAGVLLLPYIIWVSFAIYLNYSIYYLNPN